MTVYYEYECALSGITEEGGPVFEKDKLGDMPLGWTKITLQRREINPRWVRIQQAKRLMVEATLAQLGEGVTPQHRAVVEMQIQSQFHAMEADTPMYLTIEEEVFVASPDKYPEIADAFNDIRESLGLEPILPEEEGEEEVEAAEEEGAAVDSQDASGDTGEGGGAAGEQAQEEAET